MLAVQELGVDFLTIAGHKLSGSQTPRSWLWKEKSQLVSFVIKGGKQNAVKFMDSLQLASNDVHVADIRTAVLHPATTTHRQLNEEQLIGAGISEGLVRISVGLEHIDDILADIEQALSQI